MEGRLDGDVPRQTKLSLTLPVPLSAPGAQPPIKPVTPAVSTSLFDPEELSSHPLATGALSHFQQILKINFSVMTCVFTSILTLSLV